MTIPSKIHGFAVLKSAPRIGGGFVVLVDKGECDSHRYVTAVWSKSTGDEWCWGHYFSTLEKAEASFDSRRSK